MKQHNDLYNLISFLRNEKIELSTIQQEKLKKYLDLVIAFSLSHRVVSRADIDFIVNKHFLSSFCFVKQIKKSITSNDHILDLGSGAGFPGILLSIFFEDTKVVLVDSVRKKTLILKRIIKDLDLFCEVVNMRIDDFKEQNLKKFQFITARALASIDGLINLSSSFLNYGELHTIKGLDYKNEYTNNNNYEIYEKGFSQNWVNYSGYLENKVYLIMKSKNEK